MERNIFTEEHALFRKNVRAWVDREIVPYKDVWEEANIVPRELWLKAGEAGLLCPNVAEEYGGLGLDFGFNAVIVEELGYAGSSAGIGLHSDIVAPYIAEYGSEELRHLWLPRMISGETPTACGPFMSRIGVYVPLAVVDGDVQPAMASTDTRAETRAGTTRVIRGS